MNNKWYKLNYLLFHDPRFLPGLIPSSSRHSHFECPGQFCRRIIQPSSRQLGCSAHSSVSPTFARGPYPLYRTFPTTKRSTHAAGSSVLTATHRSGSVVIYIRLRPGHLTLLSSISSPKPENTTNARYNYHPIIIHEREEILMQCIIIGTMYLVLPCLHPYLPGSWKTLS